MKDWTPDIILVGNGPSAVSWEAGEIIDACPEVARFNNFVTEGFEKFVGTKTTVWIRNDTGTVRDRDLQPVLVVAKPGREEEGKLAPRPYPGGWASTGIVGALHFLEQGKKVALHGFDFFRASGHHYFPSLSRNSVHSPTEEERLLAIHFAFGKLWILRKPECRSPYLPTREMSRRWRRSA